MFVCLSLVRSLSQPFRLQLNLWSRCNLMLTPIGGWFCLVGGGRRKAVWRGRERGRSQVRKMRRKNSGKRGKSGVGESRWKEMRLSKWFAAVLSNLFGLVGIIMIMIVIVIVSIIIIDIAVQRKFLAICYWSNLLLGIHSIYGREMRSSRWHFCWENQALSNKIDETSWDLLS